MKYEEIKIGDVFGYGGDEETVISKNDRYRIITTIDSDTIPTAWEEDELHKLKPIKEGLLVSEAGCLVYKLPDGSGYGFVYGNQSAYYFNKLWGFNIDLGWKPATPGQEGKFIEMLKKECEKRGLFEDTKIENHADGSSSGLNTNSFEPETNPTEIFNKHGQIFHEGNFATPLKELTPKEELIDMIDKLDPKIINHISKIVIPMFTKK